MKSRAIAGVLLGAMFSFGCGNSESEGAAPKEDTSNEGDPPAACTAEARSKGCGSCYDLCVCGGGSSDSCTDDGATDEPPPPPPPPVETNEEGHPTVTIVTEEFSIGPGEEAFRCQNFANPFGKDVVILKSESAMAAGSHHMFVFQGQ